MKIDQPMTIDFDIPPRWTLAIYHRRDATWSVTLSRSGYNMTTIILKSTQPQLQSAIEDVKQQVVTMAKRETWNELSVTDLLKAQVVVKDD